MKRLITALIALALILTLALAAFADAEPSGEASDDIPAEPPAEEPAETPSPEPPTEEPEEPALSITVTAYTAPAEGTPLYLIRAVTAEPETICLFEGEPMIFCGGAYLWVAAADSIEGARSKAVTLIDTAPGACEPIERTADVNGSGRIDLNDAQLIYDLFSGFWEPASLGAAVCVRADVNGDGVLDENDVNAVIEALFAARAEESEAAG